MQKQKGVNNMSTATMAVRRNQNLTRSNARVQLGPVSVGFLTVAVVVVLALLYLTQITKTNIYCYRLSDLRAKQAALTANKQELEVEAARLQSVQRIQNSQAAAKLVPESQVTYASAN
jgi:hypothetical protein